jgi:hypothetical protein
MKLILVFCFGSALALGLALSVSGCTKAEWAKADLVISDVLSGVEHGETIEQIELQVATDAGFSGTVNTIVVTLVVDALDTLIALNIIPASLVPTATKMETTEAEKLAGMGGHVPHTLRAIPMPYRLVADAR